MSNGHTPTADQTNIPEGDFWLAVWEALRVLRSAEIERMHKARASARAYADLMELVRVRGGLYIEQPDGPEEVRRGP